MSKLGNEGTKWSLWDLFKSKHDKIVNSASSPTKMRKKRGEQIFMSNSHF